MQPFGTSVALVALIGILVRATDATGYSYLFSFFNISLTNADVGFVQILACSTSRSSIYLSTPTEKLSQYKLVTVSSMLNLTIQYDELTLTGPASFTGVIRPYGFLIAADSDISVYAVKSDIGTTDGYTLPTITTNSTEFIIGGWKAAPYPAYVTSIQIVGGLVDTCVGVYTFNSDGSLSDGRASTFLANAQQSYEYPVSDNIDSSYLYVNSSRPITVVSGVSCGNVLSSTLYCDHMSETIPPISELGTVHVVPPIVGRSAAAGYLVRVFASTQTTSLTWTNVNRVQTTATITRGTPYEINTADASVPIMVKCSDPCLVMQYNKGFTTVPTETSFTDPFLMLITPVDHYANASCFGTASFALAKKNTQDFANFIAVSTGVDKKQDVLLDGVPISSYGTWIDIDVYSVLAAPISPGFHTVTTVNGSMATFAGWVYGHSPFPSSSSAYGYPITSVVLGEPVDKNWQDAVNARVTKTLASLPSTCQQRNITDGSIVKSYTPFNDSQPLYNTFQLSASLKTAISISDACRTAYTTALRSYMTTTIEYINYQICTKSMCPYVTGIGGAPALPGNYAAGIDPTALFVGIDLAKLDNMISLDTTNNVLAGIRLTIPYVGILDTNVDTFARCEAEILNFLVPFVNWMTLNNKGFVAATTSSLSSSPPSLTPQQQTMIANNEFVVIRSPCETLSFELPMFKYNAQTAKCSPTSG